MCVIMCLHCWDKNHVSSCQHREISDSTTINTCAMVGMDAFRVMCLMWSYIPSPSTTHLHQKPMCLLFIILNYLLPKVWDDDLWRNFLFILYLRISCDYYRTRPLKDPLEKKKINIWKRTWKVCISCHSLGYSIIKVKTKNKCKERSKWSS